MLGFLTIGALKVVKQLLVCQRQQAAMNKILDIHFWAQTFLQNISNTEKKSRIGQEILELLKGIASLLYE